MMVKGHCTTQPHAVLPFLLRGDPLHTDVHFPAPFSMLLVFSFCHCSWKKKPFAQMTTAFRKELGLHVSIDMSKAKPGELGESRQLNDSTYLWSKCTTRCFFNNKYFWPCGLSNKLFDNTFYSLTSLMCPNASQHNYVIYVIVPDMPHCKKNIVGLT